MRKLRPHEISGLRFLEQQGSDCIGVVDSEPKMAAAVTFADLHKLKLVLLEPTDDGPRYSLSPLGRIELAKMERVND